MATCPSIKDLFAEIREETDEAYEKAMAELEKMAEKRRNPRPPSLLPELLKRIKRMDEEHG